MSSKAERYWTVLFVAGVVVGAVGFSVAVLEESALRAWEAFLVNLLFWTGLAQGGIVASAALYLCQARWGGAGLYRLAEASMGFLPFGFFLFWPLFAGRFWLFPWLTHPIAAKAAYLNLPFLFARDGAGLLFLWLLSWIFVRASRASNVADWADDYESLHEAPAPVRNLAPILIISFVLIYSILAIDLVMSLSPQWYSTMFAAYFCFGAFLSSIMAIALGASFGPIIPRRDTAGDRGGVLHDLGKLVFGGSSFWTYLLFSMYLVIWFGDIPKTTFFVAVRVNYGPWNVLGWTAFCLIWVIPFLVLMPRAPKSVPVILGTVSLFCLIGFWLERYVLVAPSLSPGHIPFGWIEIVVTLGFAGLFGLVTRPGLRRISRVSKLNPRQHAA